MSKREYDENRQPLEPLTRTHRAQEFTCGGRTEHKPLPDGESFEGGLGI